MVAGPLLCGGVVARVLLCGLGGWGCCYVVWVCYWAMLCGVGVARVLLCGLGVARVLLLGLGGWWGVAMRFGCC